MRCLLVLLFVATGSCGNLRASEGNPDPLPTLGQLHEHVSAALRAEAISRREGDNTPEVLHLVDTYRWLASDPRRGESPTIERLGLKVKARLGQVRRHVRRHSDGRGEKIAEKNAPIAVPRVAAPPDVVLAQQLGGAAGGGAAGGIAGNPPQPNRPADYGADLVDLIERTIMPDIWDTSGGPASIRYYQPWHALVVSAPASVHYEVGGALENLRNAGQ